MMAAVIMLMKLLTMSHSIFKFANKLQYKQKLSGIFQIINHGSPNNSNVFYMRKNMSFEWRVYISYRNKQRVYE